MNWEVPSADALLDDKVAKCVHVAAANSDCYGSIEARVINWLHYLMLAAKTASKYQWGYSQLEASYEWSFC